MTGEYGEMAPVGVIDAAKVTRSALQNAVSIAALLLTTEVLLAEDAVAPPGAIMAPGFGGLAEGGRVHLRRQGRHECVAAPADHPVGPNRSVRIEAGS